MSLTATDLDQITSIVTSIVKSSIEDLPTKADVAMKTDLERFATKEDLNRFTTKFATKTDLERMESRLTTAISLLQRDSFSRLDQHEIRIARLENAH